MMKHPPTAAQTAAVQNLLKTHGIGLTGGIATGKSTVATLLRARGFLVIDADLLARQVVAPGSSGLKAIASTFGGHVIAQDGSLNRAALRQIVFNNAAERLRLEAITHPLIRDALAQEIIAANLLSKPRPFFYEAALLFETGTAKDFSAIWATYCAPQLQISRLMQRDQVDLTSAHATIASQTSAAKKAQDADVAIDTSGSLSDVTQQVDQALAALGTPPI